MRAIGAYVVAVAGAVALTVFSLLTPGLTNSESNMDHGLLQWFEDVLQVAGISYLVVFALALPIAALPFAIVLKTSRRWVSLPVAAAFAGCVASAVVLLVIAMPGWNLPEASFASPILRCLISGLFGGIVYALAMQEPEPGAP